MPYLGIYKLKFEKKILSYLIPVPPIFSEMQSSVKNKAKKKKLQIWDQKCHIWVFLKCNFEKLLSYLKSTIPNL